MSELASKSPSRATLAAKAAAVAGAGPAPPTSLPAPDDDASPLAGLFAPQPASAYARVPSSASDYALRSFWRRRYAAEALDDGSGGPRDAPRPPCEWYDVPVECALALVPELAGLPPHAVVLHLGCGTSAWGPRLARLTGAFVLDSDVDADLMARLRRGHINGERGGSGGEFGDVVAAPPSAGGCLGWAALDAAALAVRPGCADVVLDKGVLDALSAGQGGAARVRAAVASACAAGGCLVAVSANAGALLRLLTEGGEWGGGAAGALRPRARVVAFPGRGAGALVVAAGAAAAAAAAAP